MLEWGEKLRKFPLFRWIRDFFWFVKMDYFLSRATRKVIYCSAVWYSHYNANKYTTKIYTTYNTILHIQYILQIILKKKNAILREFGESLVLQVQFRDFCDSSLRRRCDFKIYIFLERFCGGGQDKGAFFPLLRTFKATGWIHRVATQCRNPTIYCNANLNWYNSFNKKESLSVMILFLIIFIARYY